MALLRITTTANTLAVEQQRSLAQSMGELVYTAEGFGASRLAPNLTWAAFDTLPEHAMLLAIGERPAPLYYVEVTTLAGALDAQGKRVLGEQLTMTLLRAEGAPMQQDGANRVWVRFIDVVDGDLVVGGQATSLAGLRQLVAQAG